MVFLAQNGIWKNQLLSVNRSRVTVKVIGVWRPGWLHHKFAMSKQRWPLQILVKTYAWSIVVLIVEFYWPMLMVNRAIVVFLDIVWKSFCRTYITLIMYPSLSIPRGNTAWDGAKPRSHELLSYSSCYPTSKSQLLIIARSSQISQPIIAQPHDNLSELSIVPTGTNSNHRRYL